jgi:hypothetical protein
MSPLQGHTSNYPIPAKMDAGEAARISLCSGRLNLPAVVWRSFCGLFSASVDHTHKCKTTYGKHRNTTCAARSRYTRDRNQRDSIGGMTFTDELRRFAVLGTLLLGAAPVFVQLAAQDLSPQTDPSADSRPTVRDILVISDSQSLNLEISTDTPIVPENQRLEHPDRLVFDFPGLALQGSTQHILVNTGPVIAVRTSLFKANPPIARIVVDLKQPLERRYDRLATRFPSGFHSRLQAPDLFGKARIAINHLPGRSPFPLIRSSPPALRSRTLSKRPFTAGLAPMTCWRKPAPST